jgi:hypothetical protein
MKQVKMLFSILLFIMPLCNLYPQLTPKHMGVYGVYFSMHSAQELGYRRDFFRFSYPNIIDFNDYRANIFKSGIYSIDVVNNVSFLDIQWNDNTTARYLMLLSEDFICLYNNNSEPTFFGFHYSEEFTVYDEEFSSMYVHFMDNVTGRDWSNLVRMENIAASSTLIEGNIHYTATPERLDLHINRVWAVEGGVGERLTLTLPATSREIYISIGYVHHTRPYLYTENSRPKKINVILTNNRLILNEGVVMGNVIEPIEIELELYDTPNFQKIDLSPYFEDGLSYIQRDIVIEILEIFPGTRFNHMCINSVMGYQVMSP